MENQTEWRPGSSCLVDHELRIPRSGRRSFCWWVVVRKSQLGRNLSRTKNECLDNARKNQTRRFDENEICPSNARTQDSITP